ncbi:glycosyltransferase family 4 protein [Cyanobium sp. CH-040]|uniref:glycosyltransferase family 4 protein n=1 Tax=Cyanobium sp. CH-040 TaxID=2823708 RepID=UPI0020CBE2C7|nr:glycosyltransferase family 4 protein [Cyanobium sp. CH-040]MCP9927195.1 glycosyltransferase family 4 protein [Cyanobium sp. CH-040]
MRIGIAHYSAPSDISGVTTWLIDFCKRLAVSGHVVGLHLHHFGADPSHASILGSLRVHDIEIFPVIRSGLLAHDTRKTIQFLNHFNPDLFLPQCLNAHYFAATHAGRQGLPWIFTMHSDDPAYWCIAEALNPEKNGGTTVCVSQYLAMHLQKKCAIAQPHVIPYGISISGHRSHYSTDPFRVVYSGRMVNRQKCIRQVVEALIAACRASSCIHADLLGDGPERRACERMVARTGLTRRIRFLGRLDASQVGAVLQGSQAILLMSDFEGLPVALLEAMASGVVPVVRAIPSGIPELIEHEHTGLLVSNDPQEAAAALVRLAEDQALWEHCSKNARFLIAESYSVEDAFGKWLELINQCIEASSVSYPLFCADLREELPFRDPRFQTRCAVIRSAMRQFQPRRTASRLQQLINRTGQILLPRG